MDASDAVDLARVATCSRGLHDLFSDGVSKASIEHCREASNRANISEARVGDVCGVVHEVARQRDALYDRLLDFHEHDDRCRFHRRRILAQKNRRIRDLEQALADSQRELAEAKRARTG